MSLMNIVKTILIHENLFLKRYSCQQKFKTKLRDFSSKDLIKWIHFQMNIFSLEYFIWQIGLYVNSLSNSWIFLKLCSWKFLHIHWGIFTRVKRPISIWRHFSVMKKRIERLFHYRRKYFPNYSSFALWNYPLRNINKWLMAFPFSTGSWSYWITCYWGGITMRPVPALWNRLIVLSSLVVTLNFADKSPLNDAPPLSVVPRISSDNWDAPSTVRPGKANAVKTLQRESDKFQIKSHKEFNRVDVHWQNDVIAFEEEDEPKETFYYYDDETEPVEDDDEPYDDYPSKENDREVPSEYSKSYEEGDDYAEGSREAEEYFEEDDPFIRWQNRRHKKHRRPTRLDNDAAEIPQKYRPSPVYGENSSPSKISSSSSSSHEKDPPKFLKSYYNHVVQPSSPLTNEASPVTNSSRRREFQSSSKEIESLLKPEALVQEVYPVYPADSSESDIKKYESAHHNDIYPAVTTIHHQARYAATKNRHKNVRPSSGNKLVIPKPPPKIRVYEYSNPPRHKQTITQLVPSVASSHKTRRRHDHYHHHNNGRSADDGPSGGGSFFRSIMGVQSYCLPGIEGDLESECVFTPLCWISGGVPYPGCNSLMYTCCVDAALARKVRSWASSFLNPSPFLTKKKFRGGKL